MKPHKTPVHLKNLAFGGPKTAICVPVVGKTEDAILTQAKAAIAEKPDIVEWRLDFFEGVFDEAARKQALEKLTELLAGIPLLFTFRSNLEGGEKEISAEDYAKLNLWAAAQESIDLVDVEVLRADLDSTNLVKEIQTLGTPVIASNHHFDKTPSSEEMLSILKKQDEIGADILKLAVMPKSTTDVMNLLQITHDMNEKTHKPIVTMSMSAMGGLSRVAGPVTGSAMSFGTVGAASAPGQLPVTDLRRILELLSF